MPKRKTTEQFVEEAKKVHGDKYDYSKVEYINSTSKVIIRCKKHGDFLQTPNDHLNGCGCKKCVNEKISEKRLKNTLEVIEEANKVHNYRYRYFPETYKGRHKKMAISCPIHGIFWQEAGSHLGGRGCPDCFGTPKKTTEQFVEDAKKIHGDKFDYSLVDYKTNADKVKIVCKQCGETFEQSPNRHLSGDGCPNCRPNKKLTFEEFKVRANYIHFNLYEYSKEDYKNTRTKIRIFCKKCNQSFSQTPMKHLCGRGCPFCKKSKGENRILNILNKFKINTIPQKTYGGLIDKYDLSYDFYVPEYNLLIEYNGEQHYKLVNWTGELTEEEMRDNLKRQRHHDWLKRKYANKHNINLLVIPYWEYNNVENILQEEINKWQKKAV